jgi:hypothetical protein
MSGFNLKPSKMVNYDSDSDEVTKDDELQALYMNLYNEHSDYRTKCMDLQNIKYTDDTHDDDLQNLYWSTYLSHSEQINKNDEHEKKIKILIEELKEIKTQMTIFKSIYTTPNYVYTHCGCGNDESKN